MKDARISQYNAAGPLSGGEYIPIAQINDADKTIRTVYTNPDALKHFIDSAVAEAFCPVGSLATYASSVSSENVPRGWLLCNGQSVSRSAYNNLYKKIGTIYGSSGSTTFNLPNLKGRVVMGYCSSASSMKFYHIAGGWNDNTAVSLGSIGGKYNHQLTYPELPLQVSPTSIKESSPIEVGLYSQVHIHPGGSGPINMNSRVTGGLKGLFGGVLPSQITFNYTIGQTCGQVFNNGWQSLGCTGNNAYLDGSVTVSPDSNGDVLFQVPDQGWGPQYLGVSVIIPGGTTLAVRSTGSATPINITQPYIVMNYIIKY